MSKKRELLAYTVTLAAAALLLTALLLLRLNAGVAEFFATHFSAAYVFIVGHIASWFPFSFFEILVVCALVWIISLLVFGIRALVKKRFFALLTGFMAVAICVINILSLYTLSAGFAYYRRPLALPKAEGELSETFVMNASGYFRDDFYQLSSTLERDDSGNVVCPYSTKQLSDKIAEAYDKADIAGLYRYTPRGKTLTNSWLLSWLMLSGITFLPTAEPNCNGVMPDTDLPQTMAHEMAHAKGVAREGDANLVSYYVLLNSDDPYLRYCGYFSCYSQIPNAVYITTQDGETAAEYAWPAETGKERGNIVEYWSSQPDIIGKVSEFFNNLYLKLNGASNGTGSYDEGTGSGVIDTGEKDEETQKPIFKPSYSTLQRILFGIYADKTERETTPAGL